jgi:hypothetical protein
MKKMACYPLLFAAYPILALAAYNIHEIPVDAIWRPLLASLLLCGVVLGTAQLLLRNWHRAALVSSIVLLLALSYGQVYDRVRTGTIRGFRPISHGSLGAVWALLLVLGIVWATNWLKAPSRWTPWLNLIGALLLVYPGLTIISNGPLSSLGAGRARRSTHAHVAASSRSDVYYIILDGYARQDALREEYGYDNAAFIDGLRARGFYVAECSQSNYARTKLSLTSSLNYDYLPLPGSDPADLTPPEALLHGRVRTFFEDQGYRTVAFPTGFRWIEWTDADIYARTPGRFKALSDFEILFADTTLLRPAMDWGLKSAVSASANERARERTLNVLNTLKEIPEYPGSYFVYAHIVSPHGPYVFDADGNPVDPASSQATAGEQYAGYLPHSPRALDPDSDPLDMKAIQISSDQQTGYPGQAAFIGKQILAVVDSLLQNSEVPPIIVIQGDHGAPTLNKKERMRNLNAYYLPGIDAEEVLYPSITPVDTFRVILNSYFGQHLPMLEDQSYYSNYGNSARFELIPPSCPAQP